MNGGRWCSQRRSTDAKESSSRTLKEESKRQAGAPIRAGRSPAIAAVLILFFQKQERAQAAAKPNGFYAEKRQEIAQVGYQDNYKPQGPVRQDPFLG